MIWARCCDWMEGKSVQYRWGGYLFTFIQIDITNAKGVIDKYIVKNNNADPFPEDEDCIDLDYGGINDGKDNVIRVKVIEDEKEWDYHLELLKEN